MKSMNALPFIILGLFGLYTLEFGMIGVMPAIVAYFNVSVGQAGLLLGLFALAVAVFGPPMVLVSSRLPRKSVLVVSLMVFAVTSLGSAMTSNFAWLLVMRVIGGIFHPMFYAAALSTAMSLYPPEHRARAVSRAVTGTTLGMLIGIPVMSWISTTLSWRFAFCFCALSSVVAAASLWIMLPNTSRNAPLSYGRQLSILKKPVLWWSILTTIFISSGLFSVFSYAAQYMADVVGIKGSDVSLILLIFGFGGVLANLLISRWLDQRLTTVLFSQLIGLATIYLGLYMLTSPALPAMALLAICWGGFHACGPVVSQVWLRSTALEAPDFATSIYLTAANIGVVCGSTLTGRTLKYVGLQQGCVFTGIVFLLLALICVLVRLRLQARGKTLEALSPASG